jgi:hypothetical protein
VTMLLHACIGVFMCTSVCVCVCLCVLWHLAALVDLAQGDVQLHQQEVPGKKVLQG